MVIGWASIFWVCFSSRFPSSALCLVRNENIRGWNYYRIPAASFPDFSPCQTHYYFVVIHIHQVTGSNSLFACALCTKNGGRDPYTDTRGSVALGKKWKQVECNNERALREESSQRREEQQPPASALREGLSGDPQMNNWLAAKRLSPGSGGRSFSLFLQKKKRKWMFYTNAPILQSIRPTSDPSKTLEINSARSGAQAWFSHLFCIFCFCAPHFLMRGGQSVATYWVELQKCFLKYLKLPEWRVSLGWGRIWPPLATSRPRVGAQGMSGLSSPVFRFQAWGFSTLSLFSIYRTSPTSSSFSSRWLESG